MGHAGTWREGVARPLRTIGGFELPIECLEAKFKMGQDERPLDTQAAIERLGSAGACPLAMQME